MRRLCLGEILEKLTQSDPSSSSSQRQTRASAPSTRTSANTPQKQAAEYMRWIQERIPTIDKKDPRVYCPYCNLKNHPRWICHHFWQPSLREAFLHFVHWRSPSIPLPTCYVQQWNCETELGSARKENGERRQPQARLHMVSERSPSPPPAAQPQAQPMDTSGPPMFSEKHHQKRQPHFVQQPQPCIHCLRAAHHRSFLQAHVCDTHLCLAGVSLKNMYGQNHSRVLQCPENISRQLVEYLDSRKDIPGPLGSFLRHTTTMQSPNVPNYVTTQKYPVARVAELRTEPTAENIIAHQSYLECLQFEQNSVRCWSNMIQDQIMGEANQVYSQLGRMMLTLEQRERANQWTRAHTEQRMQQPQPAQPPRPDQPPPAAPSAQSNAPLQVKQAPSRPASSTVIIFDEFSTSECSFSQEQIRGHNPCRTVDSQ